ncbi:hypothetical protein ES703_60345 [subsurface metagenome]
MIVKKCVDPLCPPGEIIRGITLAPFIQRTDNKTDNNLLYSTPVRTQIKNVRTLKNVARDIPIS